MGPAHLNHVLQLALRERLPFHIASQLREPGSDTPRLSSQYVGSSLEHLADGVGVDLRTGGRQDLGGLALATALDELYGLGYAHSDTEDQHYEAVTREQVQQVAAKFLRADRLVLATVKPGKE